MTHVTTFSGGAPDLMGVPPSAPPTLAPARGRFTPTLAALRERLAPWLSSTWLPVALRAAGLGGTFALLGGVGALSIALGLPAANELPAEYGATALVADWLAPARSEATVPSGAGAPSPRGDRAPARPEAVPVALPASASAGPSTTCPVVPSASAEAPSGGAPAGLTHDGKVILNLASEAELGRLPGIGPKRAQAILALRERLGRFRRATDLLRVRGIGPATLQKMQPHFVLDPPAESPPDAG